MIGGAQFFREGSAARAEVIVSVPDGLQGRGLGSILVAHLADAAGHAGISTFHAHVLPENHRMIEVFRRSGFRVHFRATPRAVDMDSRPRSPKKRLRRTRAVNGSRQRTRFEPSFGRHRSRSRCLPGPRLDRWAVLHNLLDRPFAGLIHAVNPKSAIVQGIEAYPSVLDVPHYVEVAFIAVLADHVISVQSQSGALGIAVMGQAAELGLGLSMFVSVGNEADISGNDLLSYWDEDPTQMWC